MQSTQLGSSHHVVTRIGLGLAALGRPGYINLGHKTDLTGRTEVKALEAHAHSVLNAAYELGIRYFDAARHRRVATPKEVSLALMRSRCVDPGATFQWVSGGAISLGL